MTRKRRFPWLSLVIGFLLGIAGGLYYAWFLDPVERVNISPAQLNVDDRMIYIQLIAEAYQEDRDLDTARARLATLGERDIAELVKVQADTQFLRAENAQTVCSLTVLAQDLGAAPLASEMCGAEIADMPVETPTITSTFEGMATVTPTSVEATATPTPFTPTPTPALPILEGSFDLTARATLCEQSRRTGLIQVFIYNEFETGLPNIAIIIEWPGGSERIYTGLKPSVGLGYADFLMEAGTTYTVTLDGLSQPVVGLESNECRSDSGERVLPTYQLVFEPEEIDEEAAP